MNATDRALAAVLAPLPVPWQRTTLRRAAVLAPLFARGGEDWLLFTVRPAAMRMHAGQISFPGGADDGDADPVACALRETQEELGIAPADVALLGSLGARQSSSGFRVHCLVGRVPDPRDLAPDPGEVARLLAIPLPELARQGRWRDHAPLLADGRALPASPHFDWHGDVVWGLTGRFTKDLVDALAARG